MTNILSENSNILSQVKGLVFEQVVVEDRSGCPPLVVLAEALAQLPPDDEIKKQYAWAAGQIVSEIRRMSEKQLGMFFHFLHQSGIPSKAIVEKVRGFLNAKPPLIPQVGKRVEIIRWLIDMGERLWPKELDMETGIKKEFPWFWIEATIQTDWNKASKAITETLQTKHSDVIELLALLPHLWNRQLIRPEDFSSWQQVLAEPERTKLSNWFLDRRLTLPQQLVPSRELPESIPNRIRPSAYAPHVEATRGAARSAPPLSQEGKDFLANSWGQKGTDI